MISKTFLRTLSKLSTEHSQRCWSEGMVKPQPYGYVQFYPQRWWLRRWGLWEAISPEVGALVLIGLSELTQTQKCIELLNTTYLCLQTILEKSDV